MITKAKIEEDNWGFCERKANDHNVSSIVVMRPTNIDSFQCGTKFAQFGKICYNIYVDSGKGCGVKAHDVLSSKVGLLHESIFVLGKQTVGS